MEYEYGLKDNLIEAYNKAVERVFRLRHVVACGVGYKIKDGRQTDILSLIVSVVRKVPAAELAPQDLVPQTIEGVVTDVVETGRLRSLIPLDPRGRWRPALPGISIGHKDITSGTFGLLVQRDGDPLILSNNHVLADTNAGVIGDAIYQPGPADGGTANDHLAALLEFEPLDFGDSPAQCQIVETLASFLNTLARLTGSEHRLQAIRKTTGLNLMDAALARPISPEMVKAEVLGVGTPIGVGKPALGQRVQKTGRTTGLTQGTVTQVHVTVDVDYRGRKARFVDQIFASPMSSPGDSGSAVLDMERRAVGLLFAGSEHVTIFTPIQRILDHFGVTLVTE